MMTHLPTILLLLLPIISQSFEWSYENMPKWPRNSRYCAGHLQSPIDLRFNHSHYDHRLKAMHFEERHVKEHPELINNGLTVQLNLRSAYVLKQVAPLSEDYYAEQLHFHWGHAHDNVNGSEHTLEGQHYPLEMHVVTYSSAFANISEAMMNIRGLAVVGFFFQLTPNPNPLFQPFVDALRHVTRQGSRYQLNGEFNVKALIGEKLMERYYRYDGSLTTPPCFESVVWSVAQEPISISVEQLQPFRDLYNDKSKLIENTYRPVQPLGSRKLFRSFQYQGREEEARAKLLAQKNTATSIIDQRCFFLLLASLVLVFAY